MLTHASFRCEVSIFSRGVLPHAQSLCPRMLSMSVPGPLLVWIEPGTWDTIGTKVSLEDTAKRDAMRACRIRPVDLGHNLERLYWAVT